MSDYIKTWQQRMPAPSAHFYMRGEHRAMLGEIAELRAALVKQPAADAGNQPSALGVHLMREAAFMLQNSMFQFCDTGDKAVDLARRIYAAISAHDAAAPATATDAGNQAVDEAVQRFLGWRLPGDFQPDFGISFQSLDPMGVAWPTGTNLFNAHQAAAMFKHCLRQPAVGAGDQGKDIPALIAEYLETLSDHDKEEYYQGQRSISEIGLNGFAAWLAKGGA